MGDGMTRLARRLRWFFALVGQEAFGVRISLRAAWAVAWVKAGTKP